MSDEALIKEWLTLVAMGPREGWIGKAAEDLVVRLPYAPPGVQSEMRGFEEAREILSHHWGTKKSFEWRDLVIRATEDQGLYVVTGRSEVVMSNDAPYRNEYVMLIRLRDGLVVEHCEYFNPMPIVEMLAR